MGVLAQTQAYFGLAGPKVVGQVDDPVEALEPGMEIPDGHLEFIQVASAQAHFDGAAPRAEAGFAEGEADDVGQVAHLPPPFRQVGVDGTRTFLGA